MATKKYVIPLEKQAEILKWCEEHAYSGQEAGDSAATGSSFEEPFRFVPKIPALRRPVEEPRDSSQDDC